MNGEINIDHHLQYIARISHGKDSLKMLDVIFTRGLPLDRITTADIWATETIRGEHPEMVTFKEMVDEYIWRKYRIEVEHLCAMKNGKKVTYERMFYHIPKRKPKKSGGGGTPQSQGTILGFPTLWGPWCQSDLKREARKTTIKAAFKVFRYNAEVGVRNSKSGFSECPAARGGINVVEYLGIAADEPERFGQLTSRKRAPLVEFGIEEGLCGLHCQYEGILAPSYETSGRDGCWMCHNQGVNQLRQLRKRYPALWSLLLKWDSDSPVTFHADGHTVHDFDKRFQLEDEHFLVPGDKRFRWKMIEEDLQKTMF